ncbi:MAG: hypothetical protein ACLFV7_01910, partial [Phycisphaerae bacterium]
ETRTPISTGEAIGIFQQVRSEELGMEAPVSNSSRKSLAGLLHELPITEVDLELTCRAMCRNDFAQQRGADLKVLCIAWAEWQSKGRLLAAFPDGQRLETSEQKLPVDDTSRKRHGFGIPPELAKWRLDDMDLEVKAALGPFTKGETRLAFLHGRAGTGKSSIAAAVASGRCDAYMERDGEIPSYAVRFVSFTEFSQCALNTSFLDQDGSSGDQPGTWAGSTKGSQFACELALFAGLLVLDDIIRSKMKPAYIDAVNLVLHQRHQEMGRQTLLTSNLWPAEIAHVYGEATASRICGGLFVHLIGPDYRQVMVKRRGGTA